MNDTSLTRESTLVEAVAPFMAYLTMEGKTANTRKAFKSDLNLMQRFFTRAAPLHSFTTTRLQEFMKWVENGQGENIPCSAKSYARRVTTLKVFFKWLNRTEVLASDPARAVPQRSIPAPLQPILREEEIDRLLAETARRRFPQEGAKPDARPELLVRLLLDTGIKKGECMNIQPDAIRRQGPGAPELHVRKRTARDVYKERKIPLNPDWLEVLDEYMEQYRPQDRIFECTARNLEYVLDDLAEAAGLEMVSFEMLRWTCMVRDSHGGMESDKLREKVGLSRISWRETVKKIEMLAGVTQQD
ncbi:MAG: site-specific integrase [Anaerolineae bacterium]|nr:site-specific integrase [Anaerolineae bacterium]